MSVSKDAVLGAARELLHFIHKSPSPFHVVEESRRRLVAAGFKELQESEPWDVKPLDKCFVTRNQSMVIAFAVGGAFRPGNGFSIIGAHTDSPCLKVKPVSKRVKQGFIQVGVECYGGGTWHSWLDRDLKLAGRVLVRNGEKIEHKLIDVDRPIMRVPNIAIHLQRDMNDKLQINKETHLTPILATVIQEALETSTESTQEVKDHSTQVEKHHPVLMKLLSEELGVSVENILDFELCLADAVAPTLGGMFQEFIFAARLDNLHSSFCALQALIASCGGASIQTETNIRMLSLFDNEEVGSQTAQGAQSTLQEYVMRRLCTGGASTTSFEQCIPRSLMVSADMAHAIHPNYSEKHEEQHKPAFHKGPVLKFNANQRYATTPVTATIIREVAKKVDVPLQDFVVRNDQACGSTIGPAMSAKLGIPTVDLGAAQLSMHSVREMCCVSSVRQSMLLFQSIYENYPSVYNSLSGM